jgi:nucleotide-binding universal stress UspA family protein
MFDSILVLLDSKSRHTSIAQYAIDFADTTNSKVKLAYMMDAHDAGGSTFTDPVAWGLLKAEASDMLEQLTAQLTSREVEVTTTVLDNQPMEALGQQIDLSDVGLIIIAKPSGNISDKLYTLMRTTAIPMLYIPEAGTFQSTQPKILVPLDGSQRAEVTLPLIQYLGTELTSHTVLAHIVQPPSGIYSQGVQNGERDLIVQLIEKGREKATQYLHDFAARFHTPTDTKVVINSNIATSIHQLIDDEDIDLVVLSAHGESGEPKWPFGSIAHNLISYAAVPVLVVQDLPNIATHENNNAAIGQRRQIRSSAI